MQVLLLWSLCVVTLTKKTKKQTKRKQRNYFLSKSVELALCFCTTPLRPCPHVSGLVLFTGLSYRHTYVFSEFYHRKCIFSKTFSRVEILEKAVFSFTCGRTKTEVFQYDDVIHHVFLARRMLLKGCYCPSFVLAFSCGWPKTIRIR